MLFVVLLVEVLSTLLVVVWELPAAVLGNAEFSNDVPFCT